MKYFLFFLVLGILSFSRCDEVKMVDIQPNIVCDSILLAGEDYSLKKHVQLIEMNDTVFIYVDFEGLATIEKFYYDHENRNIIHRESINLLKHFEIKKSSGPHLFGESIQNGIDSLIYLPPLRFCVLGDNIYFIQSNRKYDFRIVSIHIPTDSLIILYENLDSENSIVPIVSIQPPLFVSDSTFVQIVANFEQAKHKKKHEVDDEFVVMFNINSRKLEMLPIRNPKEFKKNYHLSGSTQCMPVSKGDSLVVSYSMCDEIIIYNFKTRETRTICAKSRLSSGYKEISMHQPFEKREKINFHIFRYLYLIYDQKNKVFLRFYLREPTEDIDTYQIQNFLDRELGVAVFSHDFKYIGDFVFGSYNEYSMFKTEFFYCPYVSSKAGVFIVPRTRNSLKVLKFNFSTP